MRYFEQYKKYILSKIDESIVVPAPFSHIFIEDIFPPDLYSAIKKRVFFYRNNAVLQTRLQDNRDFHNGRFNLVNIDDVESQYVAALFSDPMIKTAFLRKFYVKVDSSLEKSLRIHKEFEYVYTGKNRYQDIHVDIPPKFLSFVFYFPEDEVNLDTQRRNATILYDKELRPHHCARYLDNSVCVFAPHFYSYHGFSTTIDRASMVMFYINEDLRLKWNLERDTQSVKKNIRKKLEETPLIEYGNDPDKLSREQESCKINAPLGRVMLTREEKALFQYEFLGTDAQAIAYQE